jgi:hypothetical protein
VGVLSDEVLRFRGERVGRRTVALRLSTTLARRCLLGKQICGLHDYGPLRLRLPQASPRAKSGVLVKPNFESLNRAVFLGAGLPGAVVLLQVLPSFARASCRLGDCRGSTDGERLVTEAGTSCPAASRVTTAATAGTNGWHG